MTKQCTTKYGLNSITIMLLLLMITYTNKSIAQTAAKKILIDISHGQKFWNDPTAMTGMDANFIERMKYMTTEITKTAASVNAEIGYVKTKIQAQQLATCDLLFIHIPSSLYEADEITAIKNYIQKGGSLFLVMDGDYWSTLEQTNVNDIISSYGIQFGKNTADTLSGGYTKPSLITNKKLKITYHGARMVQGGTPFCYATETNNAFGTFTQPAKHTGKIVVMGDGMVSLYMTEWENVSDYQCQEFMHEVFAWLLEN